MKGGGENILKMLVISSETITITSTFENAED
jgi:hypothetical protein